MIATVIISVEQSSFSSPISPTTSIESEKSWRVSGVPNRVAPYKDIDAEALQSQDAKPRFFLLALYKRFPDMTKGILQLLPAPQQQAFKKCMKIE